MKRITLFIFLCFVIGYSSAQSYHPLPDSNAIWIIRVYSGSPSPWEHFYHFSQIVSSLNHNDILIDSNFYTKAYWGTIDNDFYLGAYRHDSTGKAWLVPKDSTNEFLIRDFGKNTGDTIFNVLRMKNFWAGDNTWLLKDFKVENCTFDTIGPHILKHMKLKELPFSWSSTEWVETVGSLSGGLLNADDVDFGLFSSFINCMSKDDTMFVHNPVSTFPGGPSYENFDFYYSGKCLNPSVQNEIPISQEFSVYPNPFSTFTTISFSSPFLKENFLYLFDLYGRRMIVPAEIISTNLHSKIKIERGNISQGIYILQFIADGKSYYEKLIVF